MWDQRGRNKAHHGDLPPPQDRPWSALPLETRKDFAIFFALRGISAYRVIVYPNLLVFQIHPRYFSTIYNEYEKKPQRVAWIIEPISWWRHVLRIQVFDDRLGTARLVEANHGIIYRDVRDS